MTAPLLPWPEDEPTVALYPTAAQCFGMGRSAAYYAQSTGTFPVPVIRAGAKLRVPTAALRRVLGLATSKHDATFEPMDAA